MTHSNDLTMTALGRRQFLLGAAGLALAAGLGGISPRAWSQAAPNGPFTLMKLPYPDSGLDPVISANTIGFHYGKHHKGYVDNLNKLVAGSELADLPLAKVVAATGKGSRVNCDCFNPNAWAPVVLSGPSQCLHHFPQIGAHLHIGDINVLGQPVLQELDVFIR